MPNETPPADRPRVVHFVTGGFSGATQVAVDLCLSALRGGPFEPVLVLRRKRHTPMARVEALKAQGLSVHLVSGWSHLVTIAELASLLRGLQPAALLAHGFPEHLLGRHAGVRAGVPVLIQVEHNSRERYTAWSRWQSRQLARRSAALVGVSEGVRQSLLAQGLPADKTIAIPNGIDLERFAQAGGDREAGVLMSARFARQKDHATLIDAMALLASRHGLRPPLQLAGTGPRQARMQAKVQQMALGGQVRFLGHHGDMPGLLRSQAIYVLSTHYEGMPLALVEAMAAGCGCIASDVIGVRGVVEDGVTGLLVPEGDAAALADAIARLLHDPALAARLGAAARERALAEHGVALMRERYEALITRCATIAGRAASGRV
ncbi:MULTISPECIES: glycosyltransferase [unclassified Roseateles]|uniref:glycosyltransferase n=1 Tax=unclassified Roseateles TaxID=2626991 RepID=UPI0006FFC4B2|nr:MULTISPECIES: glycosyltransferase [unclassified Roseateles]KQW43503.1 glycosyl transferase family 1 [Pelomonas sp. Root405]KRA71241.1 glycosyl transferase family 1 [Pelomonas sp. Root662]